MILGASPFLLGEIYGENMVEQVGFRALDPEEWAKHFAAEVIRERLNRAVRAYIRAVQGMTMRDLWRHRRCKHFGSLVYFWVAKDYRKNGREGETR